MADLTQTLIAAFQQASRPAEQQLEEWCNSNYPEFCRGLASEIAAEGKPTRAFACMRLKNSLYIKSAANQKLAHDRWKVLPAELRNVVKQALLTALAASSPDALQLNLPHFAAIAASEIAAVELPWSQWPEFVPVVMEHVRHPQRPTVTVIAALDCIGYTCERAVENEEQFPDDTQRFDKSLVDQILTTIIDAVQPTRPDPVRLAALKALKNSIVFVGPNMEVKAERDVIFHAVAEATQAHNATPEAPKIRELALTCYDAIAEWYYGILPEYMTKIFENTAGAITNDTDDTVKMAAIEFWSTLAFMEQSLLDEENALAESGEPLEHREPCPRYVMAALHQLVPSLLHLLLTAQEENAEHDAWNLHAAAGACILAISQTVEGAILEVVFPFVTKNIRSNEWRERDAGIVAFGCILEGPSTQQIGQMVAEAVPILLEAFTFPHVIVQESATFCIAQIFQYHIAAVPNYQIVIQGVMTKLSDPPRVACHAASALYNLAHTVREQQAPGDLPPTNVLSAATLPLLQALFATADRPDADEANLRVSCMSAAAAIIDVAAQDQLPVLRDVLPEVVRRMELTLRQHGHLHNSEERETAEQMLGLLCGLVSSLYQKLDAAAAAPSTPALVELLVHALEIRNSNCFEEAIMAVGAIASALNDDFAQFMPKIAPYLEQGLRAVELKSLVTITVGVVVDICSALQSAAQPYCDNIMAALLECLRSVVIDRDVKPVVISAIGDVAIAITGAFENYVQVSLMLLMQASSQQSSPDDEEFTAFINSLRLSVLEAYSGIAFGLSDGNKLHLLLTGVPAIVSLLQYLAADPQKDDDVLRQAVTLIGDLAQILQTDPQTRQQLNQAYVAQLIQEAMVNPDPAVHEAAQYAQQKMQQLVAAGSAM